MLDKNLFRWVNHEFSYLGLKADPGNIAVINCICSALKKVLLHHDIQ